MNRCVIVSARRTPIGAFGGAFASLSAPQLGAIALKSAIEKAGVNKDLVEEVILGNVLQAGQGQAPTRQAATFEGGLGYGTICTTVNKVCASGMKSIMFGAQQIMLGQREVVVAGGFESMSNVPYYMAANKGRFNGHKYGHGKLLDGVLTDGLTDAKHKVHMGECGEMCSDEFKISREEQDAFAIESYTRAIKATEAGCFNDEIEPVSVPQGRKPPLVISQDEEVTRVKLDKIPALRSAFRKEGTITAANASSLNDGASALVLMCEKKAQELGLKPLARVVGFDDAAQEPEKFTTAPALAIPRALKRAGMQMSDVDYFEINEAFSVVALANLKLLNIDPAICNIYGGAVGLGHPIGMSGARIVGSLAHILQHKDAKVGVAAICNGGGGASAVVIERI